MLASRGWKEETAKEIIEEFEQMLCDNDIKINNVNPAENKFESEYSYINEKESEVEFIDEHQLAENHERVSAKEREDGKAKISRIYRKIRDITRGGKEYGR